MKNIFDVDSDEIKRILSLHEESTKKQYLNVLNEQLSKTHDSYKLLSDITLENNTAAGEGNLKLYKGTVFTKSKKAGYLETNTTYGLPQNMTGIVSKINGNVKGIVYYRCKTAKFFIPGKNYSFYEDTDNVGYQKTLTGSLKSVCNSQQGQYNAGGGYTFGNGQFTIPKDTKFLKTTGGASFKAMYVVKLDTKNSGNMSQGSVVTGVFAEKQNFPVNAFFSCKDSKFYITSVPQFAKQAYTEDKGLTMTNKLKQLYCNSAVDTNKKVVDPKLDKAQKCGHKSWAEYKASNWACIPTSTSGDTSGNTQTVVDDSKLTPKQKEYKDKVTNINKQIQTALGVQGGDGNLTQADYQAIYNKLLQ